MATLSVIANPAARNYVTKFSDPDGSGDYAADCALGRQLADELLADMRASGFYGNLAHVVRDIARHGAFGGLQVGFFQRIAERAAR